MDNIHDLIGTLSTSLFVMVAALLVLGRLLERAIAEFIVFRKHLRRLIGDLGNIDIEHSDKTTQRPIQRPRENEHA